MAALYSKVTYTGVAHNTAHEVWLQDLLQRMFVAMVLNHDVTANAELIKNVSTYLTRAAEAAKLLSPKATCAFGHSFTGDDDSDANDQDNVRRQE